MDMAYNIDEMSPYSRSKLTAWRDTDAAEDPCFKAFMEACLDKSTSSLAEVQIFLAAKGMDMEEHFFKNSVRKQLPLNCHLLLAALQLQDYHVPAAMKCKCLDFLRDIFTAPLSDGMPISASCSDDVHFIVRAIVGMSPSSISSVDDYFLKRDLQLAYDKLLYACLQWRFMLPSWEESVLLERTRQ